MHPVRGLRYRRSLAAAALALAVALAVARGGGAQEAPEIADLMARQEEAFGRLVKSLMLVPVQELAGDTPYDAVVRGAGEIVETAQTLPTVEDFRGDRTFLAYARQLEGAARELRREARARRLKESVAALTHLQSACLRCHGDYRF